MMSKYEEEKEGVRAEKKSYLTKIVSVNTFSKSDELIVLMMVWKKIQIHNKNQSVHFVR